MIDISLALDRNLITYPGDARYEHYDYKTHVKDGVQIERILMETHSGTHVDAPFHAIPGAGTMASVPLERLNGRVSVIEVSGDAVRAGDLPDRVEKRVIFKTKNSGLYDRFHEDFCYVAQDAAEKLVAMGIEAVGIDYLSIEQFGTRGMKVHKIFLSRNVSIIEGLNLAGVAPGTYEMVCLPLKIDADGAPCRAVLL